MAASRCSSRPLVLRRVAEPARDQIRILAQAYDYLLNHSVSSRSPMGIVATNPVPANYTRPDTTHTQPDSLPASVQ